MGFSKLVLIVPPVPLMVLTGRCITFSIVLRIVPSIKCRRVLWTVTVRTILLGVKFPNFIITFRRIIVHCRRFIVYLRRFIVHCRRFIVYLRRFIVYLRRFIVHLRWRFKVYIRRFEFICRRFIVQILTIFILCIRTSFVYRSAVIIVSGRQSFRGNILNFLGDFRNFFPTFPVCVGQLMPDIGSSSRLRWWFTIPENANRKSFLQFNKVLTFSNVEKVLPLKIDI